MAASDPTVTVTHEYKFMFYDVPTIEALTRTLDKAAEVMGADARVHFRATDSQRDGHTLTAIVTAAATR